MKRRHFSPVSPTVAAAAAAKKSPLFPCSEERKLDTSVLQYQNQKLSQQLEVQKFEYYALENKLNQLKDEQETYDDILAVVNKSWELLVDDLGSLSNSARRESSDGHDDNFSHTLEDGAACPAEEDLFCRLLERGATETSSGNVSHSQMEDCIQGTQATTDKILVNIVSAINRLWNVNNWLTSALLRKLPEDELIRQIRKTICDSHMGVKNLRLTVGDLQIKHMSLAKVIQGHRDTSAKYKAQTRWLAGELESTTIELKESNRDLSALKSQRDTGQGTHFLFPTLGGNCTPGEGTRDRQKELQELESAHSEMLDLASTRLLEILNLHNKRKEMFSRLSDFQNALDVKHDSSSKHFVLRHDQLEKSRTEVDNCWTLLEKLQVEKDNLAWRGKDVSLKVEMADISHRASTIAESRIAKLENLLLKQMDERVKLETKLQDASREPGRKEIISEFKALLSSLPKEMETMQNQLTKHKEDASKIHFLRAEVKSLASFLERKENELNTLSRRSVDQISEIQKCQAVVRDLKRSDQELKLFLEMYKRESTDSRDVLESRDSEYKAWAHVQSLKSSLDELSLELRVKAANEAEAVSQQRLATAEAEIAELRQKLEVSGRDIVKLSEVLKSKCEEGEAYLSEIESIFQAYEDLQTQNQNLLQQITERDDYNIKLVLERVKERQLQDGLQMEIQSMNKDMEQAHVSLDFYHPKVVRLEEQIRNLAEQVGKLVEDGWQNSMGFDNIKKRLQDVQRETQHLRKSLDESHTKVQMSRKDFSARQIELEEERFNNNRIDEDVEVKIGKAARLKARTQGSSILEKLQQELREYKGILKCGICDDRQKEVVIAKCYHLLCNPCVQRTLENRQRKCPVCSMSFGPNDIKPIYI